MYVIFLDFDGVLNHRGSFKKYKQGSVRGVDPRNVKFLNLLMLQALEKLGELPEIVVSSTWRTCYPLEQLKEILKASGFEYSDRVVGVTPVHGTGTRGFEIQMWLEHRCDVDSFVILDDNTDMVHFRNRLVQTSDALGMQANHIRVALKHLSRPFLPKK